MSKEKPLMSDEITNRAEDMVNKMRTDDVLTNAEIVMILEIAKMMQIQAITLEVEGQL